MYIVQNRNFIAGFLKLLEYPVLRQSSSESLRELSFANRLRIEKSPESPSPFCSSRS